MSQLQSITGANDNSPAWVMRKTAPEFSNARRHVPVSQMGKVKRSFPTGLLWLIPLAALAAGIAAWWYRVPIQDLLWAAAGIGMVQLTAAAMSRSNWRIKNLSVLVAAGAFSTAFFAAASQAGITLYATDISVMVSGISLALAWIFKSRPVLMLSGFSGLLWLASLTPEISAALGIGAPTSQGWLPIFPLLVVAQALLAKHLKSYSTLGVTILAAYGYIATISASLPLLPLAGLVFAGAAAHHRVGKAWADTDVFGARLHIVAGWLMALGAAFYVQSHWLNSDANQAEPLWATSQMWWFVVGLATFCLFLSSIMRYKHAQITLTGIFLVSASALIIPIATVRPDLAYLVFDAVPGLPARPGFGVLIGASIITSGLAWIVNGLRKSEYFAMTLGALVVITQGLIIFNPAWISVDFAIVFSMSLICALCISGLISGSSLSHARPAKRYG
jgi:hypothetical protein